MFEGLLRLILPVILFILIIGLLVFFAGCIIG